ncbi:MAG: nuclear transport factor 2 family protein [Pseudomonadota bacterium]
MTNRAVINDILNRSYAARLNNDPEGSIDDFAKTGVFSMFGAEGGHQTAVNSKIDGGLAKALKDMTAVWRWREVAERARLIDGNRASVHYDLTADFTPTGETVVTEIIDLWRFEDGAVAELREFVDTALLQRLEQAAG